ncbi:hypothetical protein WP3W19E03_13500 [Aeromonas veronii]|uniref:Uncharacterized protein n=1 Tax=Aeromonas veronii TaxID=654 RepID=A0A6S5C8X3_AERVE|nr:hypothetical protein WP3W19E03_13500 [Aeromonas veronii]
MATALGCSPQFADFNHIFLTLLVIMSSSSIMFLAVCIPIRNHHVVVTWHTT